MAISLGDAVLTLGADSAPLRNELNNFSSGISKTMAATALEVTKALGEIGSKVRGNLMDAANSAMDFQTSLAEVSTLGVQDMGKIEESVKKVATTYGLDLVNNTKAAYQAISAGVSEMEAPLILEKSARAAIAGVSDLATSLTMGVGVANAFGIEYGNINKVFNEAFIAVKLGVTTFDELAGAVGRVAPTMKGLGIDSAELFAAMVGLTKAGIDTNEAVTGLKAALSAMMKPSQEASDLAYMLGIEMDAAALRSKGFSGVLEELKTKVINVAATMEKRKLQIWAEAEALAALETRTKEQNKELKNLKKEYEELGTTSSDTAYILSVLLGSTEAANAIMALTGEQADDFSAALKEMGVNAKAVDDAFGLMAKNNATQIEFNKLTQEIKILVIEIGTSLLPTLKQMAKDIIPIVKDWAEWIRLNPELASSLAETTLKTSAFLEVAGPVAGILTSIVTTVGMLTMALGGGAAGAAVAGGGGAAAGGATLGGVATGGGLAGAATVATLSIKGMIAQFVLLPVAVALAIVEIGNFIITYKQWWDAEKQLTESNKKVDEQLKNYIETLKAKGVQIDDAKLKTLDYNETMKYLADQESRMNNASLDELIMMNTGKQASLEQLAQAKNLLINENLNNEEAALVASKDLSKNYLNELLIADKDRTQFLLEEVGIRVKANANALQEQTWAQKLAYALEVEEAKQLQTQILSIEDTTKVEMKNKWIEIVEFLGNKWAEYIKYVAENQPILNPLGTGGIGGSQQPIDNPLGNNQFAKGVNNFRGGMALVGERGPEIVNLPKGSDVIPNRQSMQMLQGGRGAVSNTINISVNASGTNYSPEDIANIVANKVNRTMIRQGAY